MAAIHWTRSALRDARDIVEYIAKDSPAYAVKLGDKFFETVERLDTDPRVGWMVPEFERDDIRELLVSPYRIVVAVVHGSRDLLKIVDPDKFD